MSEMVCRESAMTGGATMEWVRGVIWIEGPVRKVAIGIPILCHRHTPELGTINSCNRGISNQENLKSGSALSNLLNTTVSDP